MKFKEYFQLICEVTVDQVKARFESKAWKRAIEIILKSDHVYKNTASDNFQFINKEATRAILAAVPQDIPDADKGNALNWIISVFLSSEDVSITYEDFALAGEAGVLKGALELFYQIKQIKPQFLRVKAIEQLKTFDDLYSVIKDAKPLWQQYINDKAEKDTKTDINASKVLETAEWSVYVPKTKGAAIQLGKGTDWCTAAPGLQYYEHYVKTSPLVIFINKQDPELKYQFWYNDAESQFMNPRDEDILYSGESEMFYKLNELVKQFANLHPKLEESNNYEYKLLEDGEYMLRTPKKTVYYDKNKELHREDGPARITQYLEEYYNHGLLHRIGGPARISKSNDDTQYTTYQWFVNGWHRHENKPTTVAIRGNEKIEAYENERGSYHRENGPAIIRYRDDKIKDMTWYKDGEIHRLDGPALIYESGLTQYYIEGIQFTKEEFYDEKARERKLHSYF